MSERRAQLWARSGGRCEVSGRPLDFETFDAHHRRPKGMGGTTRANRDAIECLLALDPIVHNGGPQSVHGDPLWARARGYLVRKNVDYPEQVPVLIHGHYWMLLGRDGQRYPLPPGLAPLG